MQVAALEQTDLFSKRFVYYLAIFWSVAAAIYIGFITFGTIPEDNIRFADTILGFLLGTIVGQIVAFFFGSSSSSQNKDSVIKSVVDKVGVK
jgi:purine-cytosine permease-like protein